MAKNIPIRIGEKFIRPEAPETVWAVEHFVELPGLPRHAKMIAENRRRKMMTISEVALWDQKLYRRLDGQEHPAKAALPAKAKAERVEPAAPILGIKAPDAAASGVKALSATAMGVKASGFKKKRRLFGIDFDVLPTLGPLPSR